MKKCVCLLVCVLVISTGCRHRAASGQSTAPAASVAASAVVKPAAKPVQPKPLLDNGILRTQMEQALVHGLFCTSGQVQLLPTVELRRRVYSAAARARENLRNLDGRLDRFAQNDPELVAEDVRAVLRKSWEMPGDLPAEDGSTDSDARLLKKVAFVEEYAHTYEQGTKFVHSPDARSLQDLQSEVKHVLSVAQ